MRIQPALTRFLAAHAPIPLGLSLLLAVAFAAPSQAQRDFVFDWPVGTTVDEKLVPGHGWEVMQRYSNHNDCIDGGQSPDYGVWVDIANQNQCCADGANCNDCCNGSYSCRRCARFYPHLTPVSRDNAGTPQYRVHAGIDFKTTAGAAASSGRPVYAAADGIVTCVATHAEINYPGGAVTIKHRLPDDSVLYTMYGHVTSSVNRNQVVLRGQQIGTIHNQGGLSHLHFELREFDDPPAGTPKCAGRGYTARGVGDPASEDYRDPVPFYFDDDSRRDFPVMLRMRDNGTVNVRDQPTTTGSTILETLAADDQVVAIDRQQQADGSQRYWYKIQRDEDEVPDTAWVASYFVGSGWSGGLLSNEQDDWSCGLPCEQCILNARHDVLTNYAQWGWNVSCSNLPAVVDDWCNNLDPAACNQLLAGQCAGSCSAGACGEPCSDCLLQERPDVLSNYEIWGWDTSCWNRPNITNDWCNNLDPTACNNLKASSCSTSCGTQGCGNPCPECVLTARPDVLQNYGLWGWDTSCSSYPAIVDDWCTNLDPSACSDIKASACSASCGAGSCGNPCPECVLTARPDVLENYGLWGWDTSCSSYPAIVDDWCNNLDPAACNDLEANTCSATCGASSCGNPCSECVLTERPDVLSNYALWGWDTSCSNYPAIADDWCTNLDPAACNAIETGSCSGVCTVTPPPGGGPASVTNFDIESNASGPFGPIAGWGPNGAWASHSQFPAGNNQGLGASFGYYSAGTSETVGQVLGERFAASTTYTFQTWAIGGGNRTGRVPLQIGYAAVDGDLSSFVPLATRIYDLTGNTSWVELPGVSHTTGASGPEIGRQVIVRFGSGNDGGSSDIWFDDLTVTVGGPAVPPPADPFLPPANGDIESSPSGPFGPIAGWGPNGAWASHSQFAAGNNQGLGARFGYYSAGTSETVGQVLAGRFEANTTYTFKSWAIGGGNRTGRVPYQIGYAATDGDLGSFVPLATHIVDLNGNTSWVETVGVSHSTGAGGSEIGKQVIVRFGSGSAGGVSDIWFDHITVTAQ